MAVFNFLALCPSDTSWAWLAGGVAAVVIPADVVAGVPTVADPPIACVTIVAARCLTEIEQAIWNVH